MDHNFMHEQTERWSVSPTLVRTHTHTVSASLENGAENEKHEPGSELFSNKACEGLGLTDICQAARYNATAGEKHSDTSVCVCVSAVYIAKSCCMLTH